MAAQDKAFRPSHRAVGAVARHLRALMPAAVAATVPYADATRVDLVLTPRTRMTARGIARRLAHHLRKHQLTRFSPDLGLSFSCLKWTRGQCGGITLVCIESYDIEISEHVWLLRLIGGKAQ